MDARYAAKADEVILVDAEWTRWLQPAGDERPGFRLHRDQRTGLENRYGPLVHRGFESPLSA
jgi:hypothetical protein